MAKILVIDDEPMVLEYLRMCLEKNSHEVSYACDGNEASIEQVKSSVDLVITDIFMPGEDGFQTIKRLREEAPGLPIIAMTGGATGTGGAVLELMLETASVLGAVGVLEKPFSAERLREAVQQALAH